MALAETKKVVSAVEIQQKLTTFEQLYTDATPEERKRLLQKLINYLVYTPDEIQLALFDNNNNTDRINVQRDGEIGCPSGIRTPIT